MPQTGIQTHVLPRQWPKSLTKRVLKSNLITARGDHTVMVNHSIFSLPLKAQVISSPFKVQVLSFWKLPLISKNVFIFMNFPKSGPTCFLPCSFQMVKAKHFDRWGGRQVWGIKWQKTGCSGCAEETGLETSQVLHQASQPASGDPVGAGAACSPQWQWATVGS